MLSSRLSRPARLLLVEDSDDFAELTALALQSSGLRYEMHRVRDGIACMLFLLEAFGRGEGVWPDVILLDLHMPRMSGYKVIEQLAAHEQLREVPVVITSTLSGAAELCQGAGLRRCSALEKPVDVRRLQRLLLDWLA